MLCLQNSGVCDMCLCVDVITKLVTRLNTARTTKLMRFLQRMLSRIGYKGMPLQVKKTLGWEPVVPLKDGLALMVEDFAYRLGKSCCGSELTLWQSLCHMTVSMFCRCTGQEKPSRKFEPPEELSMHQLQCV